MCLSTATCPSRLKTTSSPKCSAKATISNCASTSVGENSWANQPKIDWSRVDLRGDSCTKPIKGVTVAPSPTGVARMPASTVTIDVAADGGVRIAPWDVDWAQEDIDGDGKPGVTFTVSGTFCSGDVYVASQSHYTVERAQLDERGLSGELNVAQKQQILGASGLCLRAMAGDSTESQKGTFAYRPVPAGTTCQSLAGKPWPVKAQKKADKP